MDTLLKDLSTADLSPETLRATIDIYLQDLDELQLAAKGKGKRREGEMTDHEVAIAASRAELISFKQAVLDRTMCASIFDAVRQDAPAIAEAVQAEAQARQDREMACSLGGVAVPQPAAARPSRPTFSVITEPLENDFIDKLGAIYISDPTREGAAESSAWAASRPRPGAATPGPRPDTPGVRQCVICRDYYRFYEVASFPCQHHMCRECLVDLFTRLLSDQTLFPPRCCRDPIALDQCRFLLGSVLVGKYLAKKLEYETPNPTYCWQPTCSQFIPPQGIRDNVGTCVKCGVRTCVLCKGQAHVGTDCPQDMNAQIVLELAEREGWRRCYSCHRMVELDYGCNHMSESTCLH